MMMKIKVKSPPADKAPLVRIKEVEKTTANGRTKTKTTDYGQMLGYYAVKIVQMVILAFLLAGGFLTAQKFSSLWSGL